MIFIADFFAGISYFFRSLSILFSNNNWLYFLFPLIIKIILFFLTVIGILALNDILREYLKDILSMNEIPEKGHWLSGIKNALRPHAGMAAQIMSFLSGFFILYLLSTLNKYILLIALSPVLSFTSEMTEKKLSGKTYSFRMLKFLKDISRGIIIALRNLSLEYLLFFAGFFLLLIPVSGIALFSFYQLFLIVLSWYFLGFSLMDYSCERHGMGIRESLSFMRKNKGLICGIGCMYWILITPPIFGDWIGVCFAPIMGAVGSSMAFLEINKIPAHGK